MIEEDADKEINEVKEQHQATQDYDEQENIINTKLDGDEEC